VSDPRFWSKLTSLVSGASVVIDRPKGSAHPRLPTLIYPLDYGYLSGTSSGDGLGIDVWLGSLDRRRITGVVCTVDLDKRDTEIKILLGCTRAEQERVLSIHNYRGGPQGAILVSPPLTKPVRRTRAGGQRTKGAQVAPRASHEK